MLLLGAESVLQKLLERVEENFGVGMMLGIGVAVGVTLYLVVARKTQIALLLMLTLSLLTTANNPSLSTAALFGRYYFLFLAAALTMTRASPGHPALLTLAILYAAMNMFGMLYTPDITTGLVRAGFVVLMIPAFMFAFGPQTHTVASLLKFVQLVAMVGVVLALLHAYFIGIAPQGGGISRYASFFSSAQTMSLATATVTLPMAWALLTKNAGKLFVPILIGFLVNVTTIVASTQRTALFSLAGAIGVMLLFYRSRGALLAVLLGTFFAVVIMPIVSYLVSADFLAQRLGSIDPAGRAHIWEVALKESLDSPFFGHGSGAATHFSSEQFGKKFHQAYLAIFFDFGLLGLLIFLSLLITSIFFAFKVACSRDPQRRALGVFLLASLAQVSAQGFVETGLADTANQTATQFYLAVGMVAGAILMPDRGREAIRVVAISAPVSPLRRLPPSPPPRPRPRPAPGGTS